MKSKEQIMATYEAPKVEVIEVEIERGFAASMGVNTTGTSWEEVQGGSLGTY